MELEKVTEEGLRKVFQGDLTQAREWAEKHKDLKINGIDDKDGAKEVIEAHKFVKKTLSTLENRRKNIKAEALAIIDGIPKEVKAILEPVKDSLDKERSEYEEAVAKAAEKEYQDKLKPLIGAGLKELGDDKYAVLDFFLTKKEIQKADSKELMRYFVTITDKKAEEDERERLLQEQRDKAKVEVKEIQQEVPFSSGPDTTPMVSKAMDQASPEKAMEKKPIPPQLGKFRSSISELQDIYDAIAAIPKNDPELKAKALQLIKNRITEIKTP